MSPWRPGKIPSIMLTSDKVHATVIQYELFYLVILFLILHIDFHFLNSNHSSDSSWILLCRLWCCRPHSSSCKSPRLALSLLWDLPFPPSLTIPPMTFLPLPSQWMCAHLSLLCCPAKTSTLNLDM